jgi:hypothetical protein
MWDLIFVGVPLLGSLILLAGSIYEGIRHRRWLFAIPAFFALFASCSLLVMVIEPNLTNLACNSAAFLLVVGSLVYVFLRRRRDKSGSAQPVKQIEGEKPADENP